VEKIKSQDEIFQRVISKQEEIKCKII